MGMYAQGWWLRRLFLTHPSVIGAKMVAWVLAGEQEENDEEKERVREGELLLLW